MQEMQEAFLITLGKMAQILGLLIIGFALRRLKLLPEQTPKVLSGLTTKLFLPSVLLYTNIEKCTIGNLAEHAPLLLYGTLFTLISMAIGIVCAPAFERKDAVLKRQYRYSLVVPNTGAAALPLSMALFGLDGMFWLGLFILFLHAVTYSWGFLQLTPQGKGGAKDVVRRMLNPVMIAVLVGMGLGLCGGKEWLPAAMMSLMDDLGNCYVVVAVMLAGYTIGGFDLKSVLCDVKIYIFAAVRLIALPLLYVGLCWLIKAPAKVVLLTALVFAGPCGMNPVVFAAEYGLDSRKVSGMLLVTVILSVITLPTVYALAIWVSGG